MEAQDVKCKHSCFEKDCPLNKAKIVGDNADKYSFVANGSGLPLPNQKTAGTRVFMLSPSGFLLKYREPLDQVKINPEINYQVY